MSFLRWLAGPSKKVKIVEGAGGKFRWQAYLDGKYVAQSAIRGRMTAGEARKMARSVLGHGWDIDPTPDPSAAAFARQEKEKWK